MAAKQKDIRRGLLRAGFTEVRSANKIILVHPDGRRISLPAGPTKTINGFVEQLAKKFMAVSG